jgi:hypothetical protein
MSQKLTRKLFCPILLAIAATVAEGNLESLVRGKRDCIWEEFGLE